MTKKKSGEAIKRKQDRRIAKLLEQLKARGIVWLRTEGLTKRAQIKYMQRALKRIVIK